MLRFLGEPSDSIIERQHDDSILVMSVTSDVFQLQNRIDGKAMTKGASSRFRAVLSSFQSRRPLSDFILLLASPSRSSNGQSTASVRLYKAGC